MTVWSDITFKQNHDAVITPTDPDCLDKSGCRLRIGKEVYITGSGYPTDGKAYDLSVDDENLFTISPGQFALIQTYEEVNVPLDAFGLISMRVRSKFSGLINVSGFHVDPGFSGKLIFSVFNAGPKDITLRYLDDIFMIWFLNLDQPNEKAYGPSTKTEHIPSELINLLNMRVDSLPKLAQDVKGLINTTQAIRNSSIAVASIIIAIILAFAAPLYFYWTGTVSSLRVETRVLNDRMSSGSYGSYSSEVESLKLEIKRLSNLTEDYEDRLSSLEGQQVDTTTSSSASSGN